jgi:hypothetical protein
VGGRGVDIERANHGFGLKEVPNHFMHLLACIQFGHVSSPKGAEKVATVVTPRPMETRE